MYVLELTTMISVSVSALPGSPEREEHVRAPEQVGWHKKPQGTSCP